MYEASQDIATGMKLEKSTWALFVNQVHRFLETWRRQIHLNAFSDSSVDIASVEVVGHDEAVAITERSGRVIQQLEELLQKICNG